MYDCKIPREKTGLFSALANRLVYDQESLASFIQQPFSKEAFGEQISRKKSEYTMEKRNALLSYLTDHYSQSNASPAVLGNIEALKNDTTFTITTGHQLSLLTGPLYFVIKILHVIEMCKELHTSFPANHFVPVFWMASEDHDFEEIQTAHLFNKSFTWESEQTGPVGRFSLDNWKEFIESIQQLFANHPGCEVEKLLNLYTGDNLSEATFALVNALFGQDGLIIIDGDYAGFKQQMRPVLEGELREQKSHKAVQKANAALEESGLGQQAMAREINLFYLENGLRERIQEENGRFFWKNGTDKTAEEILSLFDSTPTCISPNVILRPMYQEIILPNLCYVGGGGEMAYWLQLKGVFDAYGVVYPLIQVRNSLLMIDEGTAKKMETVEWTVDELFADLDAVKKHYVLNHSEELDFSSIRSQQEALAKSCMDLSMAIDPNMKGFVEGEMTRMSKQIDTLEQKLIRAEKAKHEKALKLMDQIKERLFPNGGLQERYQNFLHFCADGEVYAHLEQLRKAIEPFEKDFIVASI